MAKKESKIFISSSPKLKIKKHHKIQIIDHSAMEEIDTDEELILD